MHICLINTLLFVMDLMTVSLWPSRTYILLLWPILFGEGCSGRLVMKMSTSQFLVYMLTSVIIGGFDLLLHALPSNLARWLSSVLTSRSYHTCVYLLLFIGSFILLNSCMMCYNLAYPLNFLSHCHSIILCTPMHYQMPYINWLRFGIKPCSFLHYFHIQSWLIHIFIKYMFITLCCFNFIYASIS